MTAPPLGTAGRLRLYEIDDQSQCSVNIRQAGRAVAVQFHVEVHGGAAATRQGPVFNPARGDPQRRKPAARQLSVKRPRRR